MDFDDFYRSERQDVLRLCLLVTLDVESAADATQEAMLRAWERWEHLRDGRPGAWVRTVALNLCRSRWRRLGRELRLAPRTEATSAPAPVRDPALLGALGRLSARQREAIVLFYWADMSIEETAEHMGVSVGAAKQHLSRARGHLGADQTVVSMKETY